MSRGRQHPAVVVRCAGCERQVERLGDRERTRVFCANCAGMFTAVGRLLGLRRERVRQLVQKARRRERGRPKPREALLIVLEDRGYGATL